jgi:choline dehydrogenase-like flavoprotein
LNYIDLQEVDDFSNSESYDLVIVGAGAVGLYLATKYPDKRILIIESGGFGENEKYQNLNKLNNLGKILNSAEWGRKRAIGGTTIKWGGQSLPFQNIDFEDREWLTETKKWPIGLDELRDSYNRVNSWMGVDTKDYRKEIEGLLSYKPLNFNTSLIDFHFSKWATKPNFNDIIKNKKTSHIDVLYNATVSKLHMNSKSITGLTIRDFNKSIQYALAVPVILANHTIESVRSLLILNGEYKFLTPSKSPLLGAGFGEHPCMVVGELKTIQPYNVQRKLNTQLHGISKYGVRLSISDELIRKKQLLNISASIFNRYDEGFNPYQELLDFNHIFKLKKIFNFRFLKSLINTTFAFVFHRFVYKHGSSIDVTVMCEQEWLSNSRIELSENLDELGMPIINLSWKLSALTSKTVVEFSRVLHEEFKQLGLGEIILDNAIESGDLVSIENKLTDVNHQMGGAVFGSDPENSILNPNLRVHEIDNLYVATAACFPSFSHSNPTLTMLALADRMEIDFSKRSAT